MKLQHTTLKSLFLESDESKMNLEQIDKCFQSMKEGGIIEYKESKYMYSLFGDLLHALNSNGDITHDVFSEAYSLYQSELMKICRIESERINDFAKNISKHCKEKKLI